MNRRQFLFTAAASAAPLAAVPRSRMGIATTCYLTAWRPKDTYEFLEHAIALGAGGIQASLSSLDPADLKKLRDRAGQADLYLETMIGLPKQDPDPAFERAFVAAKEAGALCARAACLGGRRYETFASLDEWKRFAAQSHAAIERGVRLAEKHKFPLALENHKDWTAEEYVALFRKYSSEYFGACLDTGNNISLLDDPMELVRAAAPYTISTHVKDMAVEPAPDGFLLSEMPLGEGFLDMPAVIGEIRKARPKTRITLEMITRNPLRVPCLTDRYWATFPERNGRYLARTLALVMARRQEEPLPRIDHLAAAQQRELENDNVKVCLHYARERLSL